MKWPPSPLPTGTRIRPRRRHSPELRVQTRAPPGQIRCSDHIRLCQPIANIWPTVRRCVVCPVGRKSLNQRRGRPGQRQAPVEPMEVEVGGNPLPWGGHSARRGARGAMRFGLPGPPVLFHGVQEGGRLLRVGTKPRAIGEPQGPCAARRFAARSRTGRLRRVAQGRAVGREPPASAHASLHNHITRLRRLLDDPGRLRSVPSGYLLRIDEGELDVMPSSPGHRGACRTRRRDWGGPWASAPAALALWRGAPLTGLPPGLGGSPSSNGWRRHGCCPGVPVRGRAGRPRDVRGCTALGARTGRAGREFRFARRSTAS